MNNTIPAVDKTIALLEYLACEERGVSQLRLKKELNLSMSTAYRILQTLAAHKWVRKDENGLYAFSSGILPFLTGVRCDQNLLDGFQQLLEDTAAKFEIACKLSVRRGSEQLTLLRAEPQGTVLLTGRKFACFPVIEGSVGSALLADETEEEILRAVNACRAEIPEKQNPELIFRSIGFLHRNGFALNENNRWNIRALSAPVRDSSGAVFAALTFLLPRTKTKVEHGEDLLNLVLKLEKIIQGK